MFFEIGQIKYAISKKERKKKSPLFLVVGDKESAVGGDPTFNLINQKEKKIREGGC